MSHLPLNAAHLLGAGLGWLAYLLDPVYRRRLQDNARQAGVSWDEARASIAHAGRMVMETPRLWGRPHAQALGTLARWGDEPDLIGPALTRGKGLLILTPHLGAFEMAAQIYAETHGAAHPMTALYRPAKQAWLQALMLHARNRPGLEAAPANLQGVRQMLRALKSGHCVGLLPDQVPPDGQGVWAPFFDRPAYTMTLAAKLVQQTDCAVVLLRAERLPRAAGFVVHQHALPEALRPGQDAAQSAALINRAMEELIRMAPQQYLWSYNRYKSPRTAPAPEAAP